MAEADPLRKYVEAGIAFTQLTKARAETIVRELVKAGDVQREHAQDRVDELLDRSRKSTEGLVGIVRREIAQQLSSLGLATKEDVERLEARVDGRLAAMATGPSTAGAGAPTGAPAAAKAAKPSKAAKPAAKPAAKAAKPATKAAQPAAKAAKPAPKGASRTSKTTLTTRPGSAETH